MSKYDHLDRASLIRLLQRRDAERQLGLVWERDEIEADAARNDGQVALAGFPGLPMRNPGDRASTNARAMAEVMW